MLSCNDRVTVTTRFGDASWRAEVNECSLMPCNDHGTVTARFGDAPRRTESYVVGAACYVRAAERRGWSAAGAQAARDHYERVKVRRGTLVFLAPVAPPAGGGAMCVVAVDRPHPQVYNGGARPDADRGEIS